MKYFEDYEVGDTRAVGTFSLTKPEIIDFAERFDPLWLHTDDERATRESPFGGIIASGWHTLCSCHGLVVRDSGGDSAAIGSPGVAGVSWDRPVYPDDEITVTMSIVDKRPSEKIPDRGLLTINIAGTNQREEEVISYRPKMYFLKRDAADPT